MEPWKRKPARTTYGWLKISELVFTNKTRRDGGRARGVQYKRIVRQSGTPRRPGGLMSWAASKAVDPMVRRRALRAFFAI